MSSPRSPAAPPQEKNAFLLFFTKAWDAVVDLVTPEFPDEEKPNTSSSHNDLKAIQNIFATPSPIPATPALAVYDAKQHLMPGSSVSTNRLYDLFAALCLMDLENINDPVVFEQLSRAISKYSKWTSAEKPRQVIEKWMVLVISEHLHIPPNRLLRNLDILLQRSEVCDDNAVKSFLVLVQNISASITSTINRAYPEWFCSLDQITQNSESIRPPTIDIDSKTSPLSVQLGQVKPKNEWRLRWCSIVERAILDLMMFSDAEDPKKQIDEIGRRIQQLPLSVFENFRNFIDTITKSSEQLSEQGEGAAIARHHLNGQLLLALNAFCRDLYLQHVVHLGNVANPTKWESVQHWFSPIPPSNPFSHYCAERHVSVAWVDKPLSEVLPDDVLIAGEKHEFKGGPGSSSVIATSIARLPSAPAPLSPPAAGAPKRVVPDDDAAAVSTLPSSDWYFRLSTQGKQIFGGGAGFFVCGMAGLAVALTCMGMGIPVPVVAFVAIAVWILSGVCTMYAGSQMKSSFFPAPPSAPPVAPSSSLAPPSMIASPV